MREQKTRKTDNQQTSSVRKYPGAPRAYTRASATTEYQEKFNQPRCLSALVSSSKLKDLYHPLEGTGLDMSTYRSCFVAHKWIKHPPAVPPKGPWRSISDPLHSVGSQKASKEENTSAYTHDFQVWKIDKRLPYKLIDNFKVNQGVVFTQNTSKEDTSSQSHVPVADKRQAFESTTSYRSAYVAHPVQQRTSKEKPVNQKNKNCATLSKNPEPFAEASKIIKPFKTCSPTESDSSALLSTMHADYTAHKYQSRTLPVLPPNPAAGKSTEPFEAMTTMREYYKAWDIPRCRPHVVKKKIEWPAKGFNPITFAKCTANCRNTSSNNLTKKTQCPAENGTVSRFEYLSTGPEDTHMYWAATVDGGDDGNGPPQAHHVISCMVSSQSKDAS